MCKRKHFATHCRALNLLIMENDYSNNMDSQQVLHSEGKGVVYRSLTPSEISTLESNGCWAEDWNRVDVSEDGFCPKFIHRVRFYGDIRIGAFDDDIEVTKGFFCHSGINDATLRNVSIGNNCLIERIGNYINDYTIGDNCYIVNVATMETTEGASYGDGNLISVLDEAGDGNLIVFRKLNSQLAAYMVSHYSDADLRNALRRLIIEEIARTIPDRGYIGNNVKIVNTTEIVNSVILDGCEVSGATRISDCTVKSNINSSVFVGSNVILENSIIADGSSITDGVRMQDCFVGEACQITNGFTAVQSVFFANTVMANGEACAAFCGPFSASHHKSTLLIGGQFSFYNAGSATNFSNHAYKMGPIHWGVLERGTKTASGSYLLMPARIGAFSVVMGKLMGHPHTDGIPFSYLIGENGRTWLVPGHNIATVGLYRDIRKWPMRDMRPKENQKSIIDFDWLSPFTVGEILRGKKVLENILKVSGDDVAEYHYHGMCIKASSLQKGLHYYDIALKLFMGRMLKVAKENGFEGKPTWQTGLGRWNDLAGQLLPVTEEQRLTDDIKEGNLETIDDVNERFAEIEANYHRYEWAWAFRMITEYYEIKSITEDDAVRITEDYSAAREEWIELIKKDAEKEFKLGDVAKETLNDFLEKVNV